MRLGSVPGRWSDALGFDALSIYATTDQPNTLGDVIDRDTGKIETKHAAVIALQGEAAAVADQHSRLVDIVHVLVPSRREMNKD